VHQNQIHYIIIIMDNERSKIMSKKENDDRVIEFLNLFCDKKKRQS